MRNLELRQAEATLRAWFRDQSDRYLTRVVDECRSGLFCFFDGCHCLIGLLAETPSYESYAEYRKKHRLQNHEGAPAEIALLRIGQYAAFRSENEELRRLRTLPMALAELRRRNRTLTRAVQPEPVEVRA